MLTTVFMIITATLQKNNFLITQIGVDKFVYPFFCVCYHIYNHTSGYNYHSVYFVL